ncbi:MAG: PilZ domain-containing protein [Myxococcales bacterium]|nr:PilZ domain-containing protein [Myxococcales bacterium]
MNERRQTRRAPLGDFVTAIHRDQAMLCLGTDVSENGIFLRSAGSVERRLNAQQGPIVVSFQLPDSDRILWACGRPHRRGDGCDGDGTALTFTYVPDRTKAHLRAYAERAA